MLFSHVFTLFHINSTNSFVFVVISVFHFWRAPYGKIGKIPKAIFFFLGESSDTENATAKGQLIKSLNITNAENLEARVRKELEEQGILDPNEDIKENIENDEIMEELVRCQNELKGISSHNLTQLKRLLKVAKEEMARQEIRNKLQQADNEVMEAYRKISQARAKKKPPTKKEREQAWKALKERDIIIKQLESV